MTNETKDMTDTLVLPQHIKDRLKAFKSHADKSARNLYLTSLVHEGWPVDVVSRASGVSGSRVKAITSKLTAAEDTELPAVDAPDEDDVLVPRVRVPRVQKTQQKLPAEVVETFKDLDNTSRNAYVAALRGRGWTLQAIAEGTTISRERVRQIVKDNVNPLAGRGLEPSWPVPSPPLIQPKPPRTYVEPDPVKLARMLELQDAAMASRGPNSKTWAENVEYNTLVRESHLVDGVPVYRLALRLGVTHGAIRNRLKAPLATGASMV